MPPAPPAARRTGGRPAYPCAAGRHRSHRKITQGRYPPGFHKGAARCARSGRGRPPPAFPDPVPAGCPRGRPCPPAAEDGRDTACRALPQASPPSASSVSMAPRSRTAAFAGAAGRVTAPRAVSTDTSAARAGMAKAAVTSPADTRIRMSATFQLNPRVAGGWLHADCRLRPGRGRVNNIRVIELALIRQADRPSRGHRAQALTCVLPALP